MFTIFVTELSKLIYTFTFILEALDISVKYLIEIKQLCQSMEQQLGVLEKFVFGENVLQQSDFFSLLPTLPLICRDGLLSFGKIFEAVEVQLQFTYLIQPIRCINAKDTMKRALYKVFSNGFAKKCSGTGAKNNFALKDLRIIAYLKVAVRKNIPDLKTHFHRSFWVERFELIIESKAN
ncbi:hypothetical protein FQA39_LY12246 [Lamprigera yunnana]|nr:hypothetical protein FQA39_LY12246 [Lamprigera yunnana]